ncbi:MAG: tetratricopeptide repeat protein [Candidatus Electrothrix communis]|nr:MAG: tetratricopeptide repeat protein [Candidatus Electrothrix communis]
MEWIADHLQYFIDHPEVTWSGAGLTGLGVLYFLVTKLFAPRLRKEYAPSVSNTFTNSGSGDQSNALGDHPIGQQTNYNGDSASNRGSGGVAQNGGVAAGQSGVAVGRDVGGDVIINNYPRTPQGIPLQRPKQAEHLVGRKELLNDVLAALQPGKVVTLCGPGGIGKTALASRVAWELSPDGKPPACFPDGLLFYSFYGRKDVSLAFDHLVRSYSDDAQDSNPEAVCHLLANKQALIILDGAEEADDLPAVLRCCGGCGVLITSRKRSDAPGRLFEVKPLDELPAEEAFRLYSRGTACCAPTTADEATVRAVCKRLGGWPLALRIAGHYLRNTGESATDYLRFLAKVPFQRLGSGEHQDENAALLLRRSMDQVSEDARLALAMAGCLAFAPLGREPLMALLNTDELRACDALNELVLYGLLERQGQRWQVSHALIQTFARSEQPLSREDLERLAGYYIAFCRTQSAAGLPGYALLDEERVHCLRLIESCLDRELWQEVQGLVRAIDIYLERQGHWSEWQTALEMNLTAARKAGDRRDLAWCLNKLGYTCDNRGDKDQALIWYEQSLPIWRELKHKQEEGRTLNNIALIYRQQGRYEQALQTYQQSLTIAQEVGDRQGEGVTLNNIGEFYRKQGEYDQALQYYKQCLPIRRETGTRKGESITLNNIAMIHRVQGEYSKALEYSKESLAIRRELGYRAGEARSCRNIGLTYEDMGDLAQAEEYITLAVEIAEPIVHPKLDEWRDGLEQVRAKRQGA